MLSYIHDSLCFEVISYTFEEQGTVLFENQKAMEALEFLIDIMNLSTA